MQAEAQSQTSEDASNVSEDRSPLPRFPGPPAALATLLGAIEAGAEGEELFALREKVARLCTVRGTDLDLAAESAAMALEIRDEPVLRSDLAGWLAGLGENRRAAHVLADGTELAPGTTLTRSLVRVSLLLARCGDSSAAFSTLEGAIAGDDADAMPAELLGLLAAGNNTSIAVQAFLEASGRRAAAGQEAAGLENALRALECDPTHGEAAGTVARLLGQLGRVQAGDEVLREHAAALQEHQECERADAVHVARMRSAGAADNGIALSAVLDLGVCRSVGPAEVDAASDELLRKAGLFELLALRLEHRVRRAAPAERIRAASELANVCAGPIASGERAQLAWLAALEGEGDPQAALTALRNASNDRAPSEHAPSERAPSSQIMLAEGLIRALLRRPSAEFARELRGLAEGELDDPLLAAWALDQLATLGPAERAEASLGSVSLEQRVAERQAAISRTEDLAQQANSTTEKQGHLRRLVSLLGRSPKSGEACFVALSSLVRATPGDSTLAQALELCHARLPADPVRAETFESVVRERLATDLPSRERIRLMALLADIACSSQATAAAAARALDEVLPLLAEGGIGARASSLVWFYAELAGASKDAAHALVALSRSFSGRVASVLLAHAAERFLRGVAHHDARKAAEEALIADSSSARAAAALARAAEGMSGRDAALMLERAVAVTASRAWLCRALSHALEHIGEASLSFAWTQRWVALTPSEPAALLELLRRALLTAEARSIAEAISWLLAQPLLSEEITLEMLEALSVLWAIEPQRGAPLGRRALDVLGPQVEAYRKRLLLMADEHDDGAFAVALLERQAATDELATADLFLELAQRRLGAGDVSGAARELVRGLARGAESHFVLDLVEEVRRGAGDVADQDGDGVVSAAMAEARATEALLGVDGGPPSVTGLVRAKNALRAAAAAFADRAAAYHAAEANLFAAHTLQNPDAEGYLADLCELAPCEETALGLAMGRLLVLADQPEIKVAFGMALAGLAADQARASLAVDAACQVLSCQPAHAEAISIAEMFAPDIERGVTVVDGIYERLAGTALGVYGRRAAHYRAARQLEALGAHDLAVRHALEALLAVPTEGMNYQLLQRLVDPEVGSEPVVLAFERLAAGARGDERGLWRMRALEFCGAGAETAPRRLSVALAGLLDTHAPSFAAAVSSLVLEHDDSARPSALLRLERATKTILPKLEGPDGARTAVQLCRTLAEIESLDTAYGALEQAVLVDGDVEAYLSLEPLVTRLAQAPELALPFVSGVLTRSSNPLALVGTALLEFAMLLAEAVGESFVASDLRAALESKAEPPPAADTTSQGDPFADGSFLDSDPPPAPESMPDIDAGPASLGSERIALAAAADPSIYSDPETLLGEAPSVLARVPAGPELLESVAESVSPPTPERPPAEERLFSQTPEAASRDSGPDGFAALTDGQIQAAAGHATPAQVSENAGLDAREDEARARGDHQAVSDMLQSRIQSSSWTHQVRLLKLRRAVVLEEGLQRPADAQRELEEVIEQNADDQSALALLADLHAKQGNELEAARLWEQLANLAHTEARTEYAVRALQAFAERGRVLEVESLTEQHAGANDVRFGRALVLAHRNASTDPVRFAEVVDRVLEAAEFPDQEALSLRNEATNMLLRTSGAPPSVARARAIESAHPDDLEARLLVLLAEYKTRGMGTPRDAEGVVERLEQFNEVPPSLVALHTFLLAEALDVIQGGGAGMRELSRRHAEVGAEPLIALGMGERLCRARSFDTALPLLRTALDGDLRGLRSRSRLALTACEAALQLGRAEEGTYFLSLVAETPELRLLVLRRKRELATLSPDVEVARPALEGLVAESTGLPKARLLQRLGALLAPIDLPAAVESYEHGMRLARRDRELAESIRADLLDLLDAHGDPGARGSTAPSTPAPASETEGSEPMMVEPGEATFSAPAELPAVAPVDVREAEAPAAAASSPPALPRVRVEPLGSFSPPATPELQGDTERQLFDELCAGFVEAGDALVDHFGFEDNRSRDVLLVRRYQAALRPAHRPTLEALREAALVERDEVYARAIEHILRVAAPTPITPPPLFAQPAEPELILSMLMRGVASRESEALGIVWDAGMFRRDLPSYSLSGADRVPLTLRSSLGETYSDVAAHLGAPRALFHKRSDAAPSVGIALLSQPALLVVGDVEEASADLAYALAAAHVTAGSELVLAASLPDAALKRLLSAIMAAFGPVGPPSTGPASASTAAFRADVAALSADLWQRVPPHSERRLRELCEQGDLQASVARATARKAMRRAGLYASGEVGTVLRFLLAEVGNDGSTGPDALLADPDALLADPDALLEISGQHSEIAEVLRIASSLEYAESRWQPAAPMSARRPQGR